MKKMYFAMVAFLITAVAFSQGTITGTVLDGDSGDPLPGASIVVEGTTNGTSTDFDGNFTIQIAESAGNLVVSYIGYLTKTVPYNGTGAIDAITLEVDAEELEGVVVISGVIDIAKERETPVAVTTISTAEIALKVGNQEFPEVMNKTPGVYATKQGGGYGDSRISLRGFDQLNTAFLINGQPINDMENGRVFWSNWQGLTDVASGIQIQRGLGASKLAVPSVGGTVSIFTKSAQLTSGASLSQMVGNDGYLKTSFSYNSGKNDKGWATSLLLSRWSGNGYINNTSGAGWTYFGAVGYEPIGSDHKFNFSVLGAGQWHHQRDVWVSIRDYQNFGEEGIDRRWNSNGGTLNGEEYSMRRNFYNKPLATFNWDYDISETFTLSTSLYASAGRGGGTGPRGQNFFSRDIDILPFRRDLTEHLEDGTRAATRNADNTINFDAIVANNRNTTSPYTGGISDYEGQLIGSNGFSDDGVNNVVLIRRASMNSHNWIGGISNLEGKFGKISASIGVDLRSYKGYHYRALNDLLGLDGYYSTGNDNNAGQIIETTIEASPFKNTGLTGPKINYYNIGNVGWQGFNGMVEYNDEEKVTAVVQAGYSNQSFQREDYFAQVGNPISETQNQAGGYFKGGANYNINAKSNVFFNAGIISRQPNFDAVFPGFANDINPDLQNEKITSFELGYGYISNKFRANVNLYSTNWGNRFQTVGLSNLQGVDGTAQFKDIDVSHRGLEIEATYNVNDNFTLIGMLSAGDWRYAKDFTSELFDENQQSIGSGTLYLKDAKVGDAAQFVINLGADYTVGNFDFDLNYRFVDGLYADYAITDSVFATPDNPGPIKLPSYGLVDLGATVRFNLFNNKSSFRVNVNNLLNTTYIAESNTNILAETGDEVWNGVNVLNSVWFGFGTTWNAALRINL
jgi:outer membrane cobalamin receptor